MTTDDRMPETEPLVAGTEPIVPQPVLAQGATDATPPRVDDAAASAAGTVQRRSPRLTTIVWGLVIAAIGVAIIAGAAGAEIDVQLTLIVLLAASGIALLLGAVLGSGRRRNRG